MISNIPRVIPSSEYSVNDYYETEKSFGGKSPRELATKQGKSTLLSKIIKCDNHHHCGNNDIDTWYEIEDTLDNTKQILCESCLKFIIESN